MNSNPLRYSHEHVDPICTDGRTVRIESHVDQGTAFLAIDGADGSRDNTGYITFDDVPSAVVALFASTSFTQIESADETTKKLQALATQFIDTFREAMVPCFRQEFQKAIDEAETDWDAKCRVSQIISRYENLR